MQRRVPLLLTIFTVAYVLLWVTAYVDWRWTHFLQEWLGETHTEQIFGVSFLGAIPVLLAWVVWTQYPRRLAWKYLWAVLSIGFLFLWQVALFWCGLLEWEVAKVNVAQYGTFALFILGLVWVVWGVEKSAQHYLELRREWRKQAGLDEGEDWIVNRPPETWNPLDPDAVYYGKRQKRLNQSVLAFVSYSFVFFVGFLLLTRVGGCSEEYLMPPGGGEQQQIAQKIKIQKVIRKKFVLNPLSSILYNVPPIEQIDMKIPDATKHAYKVGYGKGTGAGFGGKGKGKVRFIRLQHGGRNWNYGIEHGADMNMLVQYNLRTTTKIAKKPETMSISRLKNFKPNASPPVVFLMGTDALRLSRSEEAILREYVLERHGMIFASAGSRGFHNSFMAFMARLLPKVRQVAVPLDDPIHKRPYQLPFFPYVSPHGPKNGLGWKVDGRWVVYYHPGDICDAWMNGHAGVGPDVWEACYQLGTNVLNYAHYQHAVWREAQRRK